MSQREEIKETGRRLQPISFPRLAGSKHALVLALLLALSIICKFSIWQLPPQIFNDSPGYLVPALSLLDGRGYGEQENGFRTPTYPLFLAAVLAPFDRAHLSDCRDAHRAMCLGSAAMTPDGQLDLNAIVTAQILLGFVTVALLYALGWKLARNVWVAALFGAGYALNLATAFWENSLLTETLTTFLVTLAVYLTLRADRSRGRTRLALGVVLGALALCHSLFLVFWILPAAFLFIRDLNGSNWRRAAGAAAPVVIVPLVGLGLWSACNYFVNGYLTPSTLSGYVAVQMVAPVVEKAPPEYADLVSTFIGYRNAQIAETGSHSGAIFRAYPAMMRQSGLSWSALSNKLTALSLYLILADPKSYLRVAATGEGRFWDFAFYHYDPVPAGAAQGLLWFVNPGFQRFLTILFWLSPFALGASWLAWRRFAFPTAPPLPFASILFILLSVWTAAATVALTNFQDNARMRTYTLPLQFGAVILVLWAAACTLSRLREGTRAAHAIQTI